MCGIAGIASIQVSQPEVAQRVLRMQAALHHRGPDDQGCYSSSLHATSFAHTRLSIIDLSNKGHQPMNSDCGRYTITFNGEIYNYQALREPLEAAGHSFSSQSDTEVILRLYQLEGASCLRKLRGMFAFCIWDDQQQLCFAARDPFGVKPFYYFCDKGSFVFASELRALNDSGMLSRNLSPIGLYSYFRSGTFSEPNTILRDAQLLPAGHSLTWHNGKLEIHNYTKLNLSPTVFNHNKAIQITRAALTDSVRAHFVSDVPVGIFLSGGIDSTVLLALAKTVTKQRIRTYSIAFEDPRWNEGDIAKRVADHFGSDHVELLMTRELASAQFKDFLKAVDQPTIDGFNTYCVARLAHEHGEKVVLSGLGGDELFGGYKSFHLLPKMINLSRKLALVAPLIKSSSSFLNTFLSPKIRRTLDFLSQPGSIRAAHQSLRAVFSRTEAQALLKQQGFSHRQHHKADEFSNLNIADTISQLEMTTYLRNQLLRDSDIMSMAFSLELRVPFVDFQLAQSLAAIPAKLRLRPGKQLLVESVPELPEWVVNRPKRGFQFPFDQWFSSAWQDTALSEMPPRWIAMTPWYRRWNLFLLDHWIKHNLRKC